MHIRSVDLRSLSRLWGELSEFPVSRTDEAITHCVTELAKIVGASNGFWNGWIRQRSIWRPSGVFVLHVVPEQASRIEELTRLATNGVFDPQTQAFLDRAGETRAFRREELVHDRDWLNTWIYNETMRPFGIEHRMIGAFTLNGSVESGMGLDRAPGERPFGERERDLMRLFLQGSSAFHRDVMLLQTLQHVPLAPREREVAKLLLTDLSEKEIGAALGITWRTAHQYVCSVMRKLRVNSRLELMAYWLRHRSPTPGDAVATNAWAGRQDQSDLKDDRLQEPKALHAAVQQLDVPRQA